MSARRALLSLVSLCLAAWLTLFVASCVYTPDRSLAPRGAIARAGDFTGVYCFESEAANVRWYQASDPASLPFFWRHLPDGTTVQVMQDATSVSFKIGEETHRYDFVSQEGRIENGVLIVRPFQAGNPFGWYRTRRKSTMYKLADGTLVLTDQHTYTGLACALVPTHERSEMVMTLRPGACGGSGGAP